MQKLTPIVLGNLMMGRCFGLAKIPFIGVTSNNDRRIYYSRMCQKGYAIPHPGDGVDATYDALKNIVSEVGTGHPLIYTNDGHLKMIHRYYDEITSLFRMVLPAPEIIAASLDKELFTDLAVRHGMPLPPTVQSKDLQEIDRMEFPAVIKPLLRLNWFKSKIIQELGGRDFKVLYVPDRQTFDRYAKSLAEEKIAYVVQKYVAGPESNIISFHSFYTAESEPLGYYVGRKIRTTPVRYGLSSCLRLIDNQEVVNLSLDMLRKINYIGPIKIDFKLDENTGKLYLFELNVRYNMWHYIGARAGINLPELGYRYYQGIVPDKPLTEYRTDLKWLSFNQDFLAFQELRRNQEMNLMQWLSSLRGKKIYQTYAADDLKPALYAGVQTFKGAVRRVKKILT